MSINFKFVRNDSVRDYQYYGSIHHTYFVIDGFICEKYYANAEINWDNMLGVGRIWVGGRAECPVTGELRTAYINIPATTKNGLQGILDGLTAIYIYWIISLW